MVLTFAFLTILGAAPTNPEDVAVLVKNIRPDVRAKVEEAVEGLSSLPIYRIEAALDPVGKKLKGREEVVFAPEADPVKEIVLQVYENLPLSSARVPPISILEARVNGKAVEPGKSPPGILSYPVEPPVTPGALAAVDVTFEVSLPNLDDSLLDYATSVSNALSAMDDPSSVRQLKLEDHGVLGETKSVINLGAFFPVLARPDAAAVRGPFRAPPFPTGDPANFIVSFVMPEAYRIASTGTVVGRTPEDGKRTRTTIVAAAVRDVAAFASKEFVEETATASGVRVHSYSLGHDRQAGSRILAGVRSILDFYQSRFGPYPWTEFKVVESPMPLADDGIAHPQIVAIAAVNYQMNTFVPSLPVGNVEMDDVMNAAMDGLLAREVARQWWGGLVGSDVMAHPFVDIALAEDSATLYLEHSLGKKVHERPFEAILANCYRSYRTRGGIDGIVDRPMSEFLTEREFIGLVRCKARGFYPAARKLLGREVFFKALRSYADDAFLSTAGPGDFFDELSQLRPERSTEIASLRTRWFSEMHGDEDLGGPIRKGRAPGSTK